MGADIRLEPWDDRAHEFERAANVAEMKVHLGGVETEEALLDRHERIRAISRDGKGSMFLVMLPGEPDPVGSVGYWEREWQGHTVYETGWKVLAAFQGRGLAVAATVASLSHAAARGGLRWVHAYPKVSNGPSNGVCRKAGFVAVGEVGFEYPPGTPITVNDWRYDLAADPAWPGRRSEPGR
jgi:RimJ/RimL family protein N-acetyltransferase